MAWSRIGHLTVLQALPRKRAPNKSTTRFWETLLSSVAFAAMASSLTDSLPALQGTPIPLRRWKALRHSKLGLLHRPIRGTGAPLSNGRIDIFSGWTQP